MEVLDSFARPFIDNPGVRRDAAKALKGISKSFTLEAALHFPSFDRPVLIAWGTDDRFFKPKYAERLAGDFPNARLEWIAGSRAFVPLDKPAELADAIKRFVV
jgi:pimeloyl-ACP methyl ester carboxylesterase